MPAKKLTTLLPAVDLFVKQNGATIHVRSAPNFHDRYFFVDGASCYQSGASFKDGAKSAPTTLTQIVDAFTAMLKDLRRSLVKREGRTLARAPRSLPCESAPRELAVMIFSIRRIVEGLQASFSSRRARR